MRDTQSCGTHAIRVVRSSRWQSTVSSLSVARMATMFVVSSSSSSSPYEIRVVIYELCRFSALSIMTGQKRKVEWPSLNSQPSHFYNLSSSFSLLSFT